MNNSREWETGMCHACCAHPCGCFVALACPCCCAFHLRRAVLQGDMTKYACCQKMCCYEHLCCQCCEENCPNLTLCCEVWLCEGFAVSATRSWLQAERRIQTDICDIRLIRFSNCMQILSCICHMLAYIDGMFAQAACIVDILAEIVYCLTLGCMQTQTHHELRLHPTAQDYGPVQQQPRGI